MNAAAAVPAPGAGHRPASGWKWRNAVHAALIVAPAVALIATGHVVPGAAAAIGVLPAALVGITPARRGRVLAVVIGAAFGIGMIIGSVLSRQPVLAVVALFAIALLAALAAARHRWGVLLLNLVVPAVAIGLSIPRPGEALTLAVVIGLGSLWSWLLALAWPARPAPAAAGPPPFPDRAAAARYGVVLGLAAAIAATSSLALSLPHPGWAAAAVLLVMRPDVGLLTSRGIGRALATIAGAATAYAVLGWYPSPPLIAAVTGVFLVGVIGAGTSRRYITPLATAFIALTMILYGTAGQSEIRDTFWLRIMQNLYGVVLAVGFGAVVLPLWDRLTRPKP
ncbi:FUSC family protein [Catellatospora methionotrophica]|uniref:FUSC family protein n=1 Tax=Catellatospora methionotrophica TaxID=121620 RepID=UPI00140CB9AF|nr:FUSC family protein [Catellatospora methionotrophica]